MKGDWPTILAIIFCQSGLRIENWQISLTFLTPPRPLPAPFNVEKQRTGPEVVSNIVGKQRNRPEVVCNIVGKQRIWS